MDDRERQNHVDELLNATLARYARAEPRPEAVDRAVAAMRPPRALAWTRWMWLPVGAAVTALVVFGVLVRQQQPTRQTESVPRVAAVRPAEPSGVAPASKEPAPAVPTEPSPAAKPSRASPVAHAERPPRLDRFPSPAPLSEQERLLFRYVAQAPPEALAAGRRPKLPRKNLEVEPLRISELKIEPLSAELKK